MGTEIERKFLVRDTSFLDGCNGTPLLQGYLAREQQASVRVRIAGEQAYLTIKGPSRGIERAEYEYAVPGRNSSGSSLNMDSASETLS